MNRGKLVAIVTGAISIAIAMMSLSGFELWFEDDKILVEIGSREKYNKNYLS